MGRTNLLNLLLGIGLVSISISAGMNTVELKTLEHKVANLEESLNSHTKLFDQVMENSLKIRQENQAYHLYLKSTVEECVHESH